MKLKLKIILAILIVFALLFYSEPHSETSSMYVNAYTNHCWDCGSTIDSSYCRRCRDCGWYICRRCGACAPSCSEGDDYYYNDYDTSSGSSSDDSDSDWLVWMLIIGIGIPVIVYICDKDKK